MPEITIVTPSWNRAELLPRLWNSLRSQDLNFQWVVVDDGSTDNTASVVRSFKDSRITYKRLAKNRGVNSARNAGVSLAQSPYVIFLDSDDEVVPQSLKRAVDNIKNTTTEIGVVCFACVMAETGRQTSKLVNGLILDEKAIVCESALRGGDNAYIYKKEVFNDSKLPEDLKGCEHVFVYAISKNWKFLVVDMPVTLVHRQMDNLSGASSLVSRSKDIAKSYEILTSQHKKILKQFPKTRILFYRKTIYRYGIAGEKLEILRVAKKALVVGSPVERIKTCLLIGLSLMPLAKLEFWRISRINKKLQQRSA